MTPEHRAWTDGVINGLRAYAWQEDGIFYVGKPHSDRCQPLAVAIRLAENVYADEEAADAGIDVVVPTGWHKKEGQP